MIDVFGIIKQDVFGEKKGILFWNFWLFVSSAL